jgi:hypothetical protein
MRIFTLTYLFLFLFCLQALGQTTDSFVQPQMNITSVQSEELQVALDVFNARAEKIPTVFEAANLESRQVSINSVTSGSWDESTTWSCSCVPVASDDVVIQAHHIVAVNSNTEINNLSIQEEGTLSLGGAYETVLMINGNWSSAGFVEAGKMTVSFSNTLEQTFTGSAECYDLLITNGNTVNISGSLLVRHHLDFSAGVLDATNGELRLGNSDFGPASVIVGSGANYIGEVIREFEISYDDDAIHRIGFGLEGVKVSELIGDIPTSGFAGSDNPSATISNILSWNEETFQMNQIQSVDDILEPGVGYAISIPAGIYHIDFKGTIQDFNLSLPVFKSNSIAFNLISNPTQAYIDLDKLYNDMTGLEKSINIWNNDTRNYDTYASGFGVNGQTQFLAPGKAFWIRAIDTPLAQINETMYESAGNAEQYGSNLNTSMTYMRWVLESGNESDEIIVAIDDGSTILYDSDLDANNWKGDHKCDIMSSPADHNAGSSFYSIHVLPSIAGEKNATVGLGISTQVEALTTKNFTLKLVDFNMGDYCAWITSEDVSGGLPLSEGLVFGFSIEGGESIYSSITNDIRWDIHISAPSEIEAVSPGCEGDGEASVSLLGTGSGPWDYSLNNSEGELISTLTGVDGVGLFDGLDSGEYTGRISNQGEYSCGVNTHTARVVAVEDMNLEITSTIYCEDALDAEATVKVLGGDSPFEYDWSNGETTHIATSLEDGHYDVIVTDAFGCLDSIGIDVVSAPSIDLTVVSPGCEGEGVTSIAVNGSGEEPWTFTYYTESGEEIAYFENGTGQAVLTNLPSGVYTVIATDSGQWGCPDREESAEVIQPVQLDLGLNIGHIGCDGVADGSIAFNVSGGIAPYGYIWSTGEVTESISDLYAGEYTAIAIDSFGCADTATVEVIAAPQVTADFQAPILPLTSGDGSGYTLGFTNQSEGATGYSWFFGDESDPSFDIHAVHTYLEAGTYDVFLNAWNDYCSQTIRKVITFESEEVVSDDDDTNDPPTEVDGRSIVAEVSPLFDIENPISTLNGWKINLGVGFESCEARAYDLSGRIITPVFNAEMDGTIWMESDVWPTMVLIRLTDTESGAVRTWKMVK